MRELKGACIFGQSGGPTSVINASAYGVIDTALKNPNITRVLGAAHGIKGVLDDDLIDMGKEDPAELELMKYTPSSALGSCRYKLKDVEVDDTDYKRILEVFKKYNIHKARNKNHTIYEFMGISQPLSCTPGDWRTERNQVSNIKLAFCVQ